MNIKIYKHYLGRQIMELYMKFIEFKINLYGIIIMLKKIN